MKITLLSDESIRLEPAPGPLTIEAPSTDVQYSPFHMLGSSLATCTFSVLQSWALHAKLPVDDLSIEVSWEFAADPQRISQIRVLLTWPSLPDKRRVAAGRVAELCTIHATLNQPPGIEITT